MKSIQPLTETASAPNWRHFEKQMLLKKKK